MKLVNSFTHSNYQQADLWAMRSNAYQAVPLMSPCFLLNMVGIKENQISGIKSPYSMGKISLGFTLTTKPLGF